MSVRVPGPREPIVTPDRRGGERLLAALRALAEAEARQERLIAALVAAGSLPADWEDA